MIITTPELGKDINIYLLAFKGWEKPNLSLIIIIEISYFHLPDIHLPSV